MSTTTVPKTYALIEHPTGRLQAPKTLATGDAETIRISYTEHAAEAEGDLQIYEIDALTGQILTGEDPF